MRLRVASCTTLPEPDPDAAPLAEGLAAAGIDAQVLGWDDPAADWTSAIPTILRSTWNYSLARDEFLAWCDRVAATAPLFNPPAIAHANSHKRYLLELAARGVPTIPTTLVARGEALGDAAAAYDRFVIKPAVAGGSLGARVFTADQRDGAAAHAAEWTARGDVLVQPYLASVEDYGERSLIWIDGAITHAIRKSPRFSGDAEQVTGPHPIAIDERAVAEAALEPWSDTILYGRVDMARDAYGNPASWSSSSSSPPSSSPSTPPPSIATSPASPAASAPPARGPDSRPQSPLSTSPAARPWRSARLPMPAVTFVNCTGIVRASDGVRKVDKGDCGQLLRSAARARGHSGRSVPARVESQ